MSTQDMSSGNPKKRTIILSRPTLQITNTTIFIEG